MCKRSIVALVVSSTALLIAGSASAETGCYQYPHGSDRNRCLQMQAASSAQYSRDMNAIADDLRRTHEQTGAALKAARSVPVVGPVARVVAPAWEAPRYVNDLRQQQQRPRR